MEGSILYFLLIAGSAASILFLERDKIKKVDLKKVLVVLVILFFLGSGLAYLFSY